MSTKIYILAGGQGTRFWPVSRASRPKQFLPLGPTSDSLIQATVTRVTPLVKEGDITVITNAALREHVLADVPNVKIVEEPCARNTAASIGLAAIYAKREDPDAVMIVLPADHAVSNADNLRETLSEAVALAEKKSLLVTIGIKPTFPHTGYGYIHRGKSYASQKNGHAITTSPRCFSVQRFFEKPNLERAQSYCLSGDFYWNSGMFVWKADTILAALQTCMPDLFNGLQIISESLGTPNEQAVLSEVFTALESISIDFGVLEHVKNCAVVEASDFGWNDVGSWDAWADQFTRDADGNLLSELCLAIDSKNCTLWSATADKKFSSKLLLQQDSSKNRKRVTAILGVENLVVIDSGDALLICPQDRVQEVKKIVDQLKARGFGEYT